MNNELASPLHPENKNCVQWVNTNHLSMSFEPHFAHEAKDCAGEMGRCENDIFSATASYDGSYFECYRPATRMETPKELSGTDYKIKMCGRCAGAAKAGRTRSANAIKSFVDSREAIYDRERPGWSEMKAVLEYLEWSESYSVGQGSWYHPQCPSCFRLKPDVDGKTEFDDKLCGLNHETNPHGHADDCELDFALRKANTK